MPEITVEHATANDFDELMAMLLAAFSTNKPDHEPFYEVFPDVYRPTDEHMAANYIVRQNGKIVSCVGKTDVLINACGTPVAVAGIGGVSTLPEYRGTGMMSAVLDKVHEDIVDQGYPFAWLGGDRQRYARWGYELAMCKYTFSLSPRAMGLKNFLGSLDRPIQAGTVDQLDWPTIYAQARQNPNLTTCDKQTLKLKYARAHNTVLCVDGDKGAHVVVFERNGNRELRAWGGDPETLGGIVAEKLNADWNQAQVHLPLYPDMYCATFKQLFDGYGMVRSGNIAIANLQNTLETYKPHLDRSVRDFNLKGRSHLAMKGAGAIPDQQIILRADGTEMIIEAPTGNDSEPLELSCLQIVELLFSMLVVGWSMRLSDRDRWLTSMLPLPFYIPTIFHV